MTTLISFDPGGTTGVAWGTFTDTQAYELQVATVVHDGVEGFDKWFRFPGRGLIYGSKNVRVVSERFILRASEAVPDVEALRIEGYLLAVTNLAWQLRTEKSGVPDAVLKRHGLWQTGRMVGHTDGRDANDAIIHALKYLKNIGHMPTLRKYFHD